MREMKYDARLEQARREIEQSQQAVINAAIDGFTRALAFFENLTGYVFAALIQPSIRYARAGHPYGKNRRGKKRWLREMKRPLTQQEMDEWDRTH